MQKSEKVHNREELAEMKYQPSITHPIVSRERFAELTGLPLGVVVGFVNKGYLPTVSIGKYSLINIELLRKRCLELELS
jgi:hypothetical protein